MSTSTINVNSKKTVGNLFNNPNTLVVNFDPNTTVLGCDFKADVIVMHIDNSELNNNCIIGNNIKFIGDNKFIDCRQHTRYTQKDKCCVCETPITLDDVIIDFKIESYCLCKSCADRFLSPLIVAMKI
jgi:hypothetical protein